MSLPEDSLQALLARPLTDIAHSLRSADVSAGELVGASLRRIEAVDGDVNAFVALDAERALAEAELITAGDARPLAGIPIAIKASQPVAGLPDEHGSQLLAGVRATHTAHAVARLERAGLLVVGTTRTPEFGIMPTTEPRHGGPVHNPWDLARSPGGSSGGSAAAVACGAVPLATGTDGGGSLRIPAACCGLLALKPSRGRVSRGPGQGDSMLVTDGVLTRTVHDTAGMLDLLSGYEAGDATWAPPSAAPYLHALRREPPALRVGVWTAHPLGGEVARESLDAVALAAELLARLGHEPVEFAPPLPDDGMLGLFTDLFAPAISAQVAAAERRLGRPATDEEIEPLTRMLHERAQGTSATDHVASVTRAQALARRIVASFAQIDVLLCPTLAERPPKLGALDPLSDDPAAVYAAGARFSPYAPLANLTGQPAISVPLVQGRDGLPTGVQLIGRPLAEDTLLQVAHQLERLVPWADRLAPGVAAPPTPGAPAPAG